MSESILNALMHLFAVIATVTRASVSTSGRKIVQAYLLQHLKEHTAREYLDLFDNYLDFYLRDKEFNITANLTNLTQQESEQLRNATPRTGVQALFTQIG